MPSPLFLFIIPVKIMKKKSVNFLLSCLLTCAMTSSAFASVTIIGTRVIYPASDKEVTVRLDNRGDQPALAASGWAGGAAWGLGAAGGHQGGEPDPRWRCP